VKANSSTTTALRELERQEVAQLHVMTDQAWALRESPYLFDAVEAIVDWFDRRHERRWERRGDSFSRVLRVLRETKP
jgi:hypothetical protein